MNAPDFGASKLQRDLILFMRNAEAGSKAAYQLPFAGQPLEFLRLWHTKWRDRILRETQCVVRILRQLRVPASSLALEKIFIRLNVRPSHLSPDLLHSSDGSRPVDSGWNCCKQVSGPPAPSLAPTQPTARPRSRDDHADPIATCVREFMRERPSWTGSAADLLRVSVERSNDRIPRDGTGWPKSRALAGHLRRAQTFLRALGIEIAFSREGRAGSRVIRMRSFPENTVSTVSSVSDSASGPEVVSRVGDSELAATSHACGWNEAVKSSSAERVAPDRAPLQCLVG